MVSAKLFEATPPFPDDIPVAVMSKIALSKLSSKDQAESRAVLEACRKLGFFLLDLNGHTIGEQMISELEQIFGVIHAMTNHDAETKEKYGTNPPTQIWGYKVEGAMDNGYGQRDRCTFFQTSQDDILGNSKPALAFPEPMTSARPLLASYVLHCQYALTHILKALESELSLHPGTLQALQPADEESATALRMIRYSPSLTREDMRTGLLPHTDFGTVTLLANVMGGLQVLQPGGDRDNEAAWQWVKPEPGCLIVNMGDAMVEWTGGVLRSNMHRVNHAPGEQSSVERLALALLVRAKKGASMDRIVGGRIPRVEEDRRDGIEIGGIGVEGMTASEWEAKKAMMLYKGKDIAKSRGGRELRAEP